MFFTGLSSSFSLLKDAIETLESHDHHGVPEVKNTPVWSVHFTER